MDESHAILILKNLGFMRLAGYFFPAKFEFIKGKQDEKPRHDRSC